MLAAGVQQGVQQEMDSPMGTDWLPEMGWCAETDSKTQQMSSQLRAAALDPSVASNLLSVMRQWAQVIGPL
jgi:hypothetical protein